MKTYFRKSASLLLAFMMIFGAMAGIAGGSLLSLSAHAEVSLDGNVLGIETKLFRLGNVSGEWIDTEKAVPGENLKARVYVDTNYYTNSGTVLVFLDNSFFDDGYVLNEENILNVNPRYVETLGITGSFYKFDFESNMMQILVENAYITEEFAQTHFAYVFNYYFGGESYNQKLSGEDWLAEFNVTVKDDAAGQAEILVVPETVASPDRVRGIIDVPVGEYNGYAENVVSLANIEAEINITNNPVAIDSGAEFVFDANGGKFNGTDDTYLYESTVGGSFDIAEIPAPEMEGYSFTGWADEFGEEVVFPETMPNEAMTFYAQWESDTPRTLSFETKLYRYDSAEQDWIYTERAMPGEDLKARLFIDTSYYTNAGEIIVFLNNEMFEDLYSLDTRYDLVVNTAADSSAAINGASGAFYKMDAEDFAVSQLVEDGYITSDFALQHTAYAMVYNFDGNTCKKISGEYWFAEFDIRVKYTADGNDGMLIIPSTIMNPNDGYYAYINIPVGTENGDVAETYPMYIVDVETTVINNLVDTRSRITFNAYGGYFGDMTDIYEIEQIIGTDLDYSYFQNPAKDGYIFEGWANEDGIIVDIPSQMPVYDLNLTAVWSEAEPEAFTVRYQYLGDVPNDVLLSESVVRVSGTIVSVPDIPTVEGYTFDGWYYNGEICESFEMPESDVVLTGVWTVNEYNAVFDAGEGRFEDGENVKVYAFDYDSQIVAPDPALTREGYYFVGWSDDSSSGIVTELGIMTDSDVTFYAVWEAYEYNIILDANGGEFSDGSQQFTETVLYGEDLSPIIPYEPVREGCKFEGWVDENGLMVDMPSYMPAQNLNLTAVWNTNEYTVYIDVDGAITEYARYAYGDEIYVPAAPEKVGYTFDGWRVFLDNGEETSLPVTMPANDLYLRGEWAINYYPVVFMFDVGGEVFFEAEMPYAASIVAPDGHPEKYGYTFMGWSAYEGSDMPEELGTVPIDGITYYPVYRSNTYDIIFDANGGEFYDGSDTMSVQVDFDSVIEAPVEPVKPGYIFYGWEHNGEILGTDLGILEIAEDNQVYTAVWEVIIPETHTVSYYLAAGGALYRSEVYAEGETINYAEPEPVDGFVFKGWVDENGGALPYKMGTQDIVAYAVFEPVTYTVIFKIGSETVEETYNYGSLVNAPEIPSEYIIEKWIDENGEEVKFPVYNLNKNMTLTAAYKLVAKVDSVDVSVTYDADCFEESVTLVVEDITDKALSGNLGSGNITYHELLENNSYASGVGFYSIKMVNLNQDVEQPQPGKTVKVRMKIPEKYAGHSKFMVMHWKADEAVRAPERFSNFGKYNGMTRNGDYLEFYIDSFSNFGLYVVDEIKTEVSKAPKTSYYYKNDFDLSGIELKVNYPDGTTETVTDTSKMKVSGFDSSKIGDQTVTVEYEGLTAEFEVNVSYAWWQWIIRILLLGFLWY